MNQSETAVIAEQFSKSGYEIVPFGEEVDLCVINTCTVTEKTDYRCRQMIRRAKKVSPGATISVVGCYAQLNPEKIEKIDGVDFVLGSDRKFDLLEMVKNKTKENSPVVSTSDNDEFHYPLPGNFWNHRRAFLKIQDGCDNFCSYCRVPLARGKSRSDSVDHVINSARKLADRGHKEIVLTGVHIGMYGRDLNPKLNLVNIIQEIEKVPGIERIRLSSMEPLEVTEEILHWIADSEKACLHLHIPLQNGDDEILRKMKRNYDTKKYARVVRQVAKYLPGCCIGTDIIVGFPGETEEHFQNTKRFVEEQPFSYFHVFSYSKRSGTKAVSYPDHVHPDTIKKRSEILREIGAKKKRDYLKSFVGKELRVLWEEKTKQDWLQGWSDNYIRVRVRFDPDLINTLTLVRITKAYDDFVEGVIV